MRRMKAAVVYVAVALAASVGALAPALPAAAAGYPTTVVFETGNTESVPFTDRWVLSLRLTADYDDVTLPIRPSDGTVDILVTGVGGIFAADLPIQEDGRVFVTQPATGPRLGAGTHEFTALFKPAQGAYIAPSQTAAPAVLTIDPVAVSAMITTEIDPAVAKYPFITAALGGDYSTTTGGSPSGSWEFTVTEKGESSPVFEATVAQESGQTEPLRVEIRAKLAPATQFEVSGVFTASDDLAPGLAVTEAESIEFTTPGASVGDALTARIPFPWWVVLALGVFLVGLVVTVVALGVKLSRRPESADRKADSAPAESQAAPVDLVEMEEIGITPIRPATWSLSEESNADASALPTVDAETAPTSEHRDGASGSTTP